MADSKRITLLRGRKKAVIELYKKCGTVTHACIGARIGRQTFYDWKKADERFAEAVREAEDFVADDLEEEAIRRAKNGSDVLLIFLLKGHKPEKFKERWHGSTKHSTDAHTAEMLKLIGSSRGLPSEQS